MMPRRYSGPILVLLAALAVCGTFFRTVNPPILPDQPDPATLVRHAISKTYQQLDMTVRGELDNRGMGTDYLLKDSSKGKGAHLTAEAYFVELELDLVRVLRLAMAHSCYGQPCTEEELNRRVNEVIAAREPPPLIGHYALLAPEFSDDAGTIPATFLRLHAMAYYSDGSTAKFTLGPLIRRPMKLRLWTQMPEVQVEAQPLPAMSDPLPAHPATVSIEPARSKEKSGRKHLPR
jgi:hypothetical protein